MTPFLCKVIIEKTLEMNGQIDLSNAQSIYKSMQPKTPQGHVPVSIVKNFLLDHSINLQLANRSTLETEELVRRIRD